MNSRARLIKVIDNSACLTRRQISDYLTGRLYPEELYVVEMHLNECPFCNDAIEGFSMTAAAEQLLGEAEVLQLPEAQPQAPVQPVVPKETPVAPVAAAGREPKAEPKTITFDEPGHKQRRGWLIGMSAAALVALGIWGISRLNDGTPEDSTILAKHTDTLSTETEQHRLAAVVRKDEDSAMNARFSYQHQTPAPAVVKATPPRDSSLADTAHQARLAAVTDTEPDRAVKAPVSAPANVVAGRTAKSAPPMATAPQNERIAAKSAAPSQRIQEVEEVTAKLAPAADRYETRERVRPSSKTPEERARDAAVKKQLQLEQAVRQSEKDYKKAKELYEKKQYAAALLYFQPIAKNTDLPLSKKAAKYVKLCKEKMEQAASGK